MNHFVYWLFDPQTDELLYIGRSHEPARRKRDFERVHQRATSQGALNRFSSLEEAQAHERAMIEKHWPPLNKRLASSPASLGMKRAPASEETRAKMRTAKVGRKLTEEHKAKIRANAGHATPWLGKKMSDETRAKMSAAHKARLEAKRIAYLNKLKE